MNPTGQLQLGDHRSLQKLSKMLHAGQLHNQHQGVRWHPGFLVGIMALLLPPLGERSLGTWGTRGDSTSCSLVCLLCPQAVLLQTTVSLVLVHKKVRLSDLKFFKDTVILWAQRQIPVHLSLEKHTVWVHFETDFLWYTIVNIFTHFVIFLITFFSSLLYGTNAVGNTCNI